MSETDFPYEEFQLCKKALERFHYFKNIVGFEVQGAIMMTVCEFMNKGKKTTALTDKQFQDLLQTIKAYLQVEGHLKA